MTLLSTLVVGRVLAADPASVPVEPAPAVDPALAELQARLTALEAQLQAQEAERLLREAEALAAPAGPAPAPAAAARASWNALNPGITAFGDLIGQAGLREGELAPGSTLYLRSLELQLRAAVDPFAKADVVIAWEQEAPPLEGGPGEGFGSEPEETYIDLVALPAGLSARVGKMRVPFGLMNRTHPHDLPWIDVPELLGEEGYNDAGGTLAWLLPIGPAGFTLTGGAYSGAPFDEEGATADFAALGRAELYIGTGPVGFSLGGSALADVGGEGAFYGGDASVRWKPDPRHSVVLLSEVVSDGDTLAGYAAVQYQPARMWYLGARQDFGSVGSKSNLYVSYYTSEFLRVRLGGGYAPATGDLDALAQLTFVYGSHPVEPWWVNR